MFQTKNPFTPYRDTKAQARANFRYHAKLKKQFPCSRIRVPDDCIAECNGDSDGVFFLDYHGWCLACPYTTIGEGRVQGELIM